MSEVTQQGHGGAQQAPQDPLGGTPEPVLGGSGPGLHPPSRVPVFFSLGSSPLSFSSLFLLLLPATPSVWFTYPPSEQRNLGQLGEPPG